MEKERGPTGTRTQGLSLTVRALYHWGTEPIDRPVTFSPCLIRFVPESARNHAGTDETVSFRLLLAARARTHTGHQISQGRKKNVARPGLEPRVSRLPCEHYTTELPSHSIDRLHLNVTGAEKERGPTGTRTQGLSLTVRALYHWATEPLDRPVTFSPCLIRFVPESARNHAGTDETVSFRLLLAARARTHTEPPNVTGVEKERGPTGTRTQGLSLTVRALYHWATEPLDRPVTFSPCLIRFVPESARNHAGTDETVSFRLLLAARARTHTEPPNVTGVEKERGPTGTRTKGLSLTVRALYHWATEPLDRPVTYIKSSVKSS